MIPMKYDVFISYSRKDIAVSDKICAAFDRAGISYFIDRQGISGGFEFPAVLAEAILDSRIVLFLASKNSYESKFTNSELTFAFNEKSKNSILPYIIDGSTMPPALRFVFASINWRTIDSHPIETVLISDIMNMLGRKSSVQKQVERTWKVGDYYNVDGKEGVVFWVDATGKHGKITSLDQDQLRWCTYAQFQKKITVGTSSKINGKENTDKVMMRLDADEYPAFTWCRSKGRDWYLPAIDEVELLVWNDNVRISVSDTLEHLGYPRIYSEGLKFKDAYFWWSSTECKESAATGAMGINNRGIGVDGYGKPNPDAFVRAVSTF